ncbi:T7SS effector LXG polymorphic toxin [Enterococcus sp. AZ109]|uniref:T7SS effector LXG polymorphic toxin n=1 Tax=Enterococcus sp. AZ109 TaxID=2774634 RepID=UPI003F20FC68
MSIDMYVGSSQAQAASVRAICRQQRQGYQQLQQAISSFVVSSDQLQGKTYDSAKQYFATVLTPLAKGGMLLTEAVEKACKKLPEEYQSQVDSGDLKQSELEEKIRQFEAHIATTNAIIQNFSRLPDNTGVTSGIERSLKNVLRTQEKGKQELEKKRRKLLEFNARSASFFSEIAALEAAVNKGAKVSGSCWNASTKTFSLPSAENMNWANTINTTWDKRKVEKDPKVEVKPRIIGRGSPAETTIYEVYVDGVYSKELSEYYNNLDEQAKLEVLHFAAEFTVINNLYRLVTGKDWLSGEKNSRLEAAGWLALTAIPIGKLYSMSKEIKAGNKLLKGVSLTENELKILHNAGYFDEVKKVAGGTRKAGGINQKVVEEITNPVLEAPRYGSGLKVDDIKPVKGKGSIYDIDPLTGKPPSKQTQIIIDEFPDVPKAHGFSDIIDNYAGLAEVTDLGNAKLYQIQGSQNGVMGRFEWIIQDGKVTHRMFIRNPELNGVPIK